MLSVNKSENLSQNQMSYLLVKILKDFAMSAIPMSTHIDQEKPSGRGLFKAVLLGAGK